MPRLTIAKASMALTPATKHEGCGLALAHSGAHLKQGDAIILFSDFAEQANGCLRRATFDKVLNIHDQGSLVVVSPGGAVGAALRGVCRVADCTISDTIELLRQAHNYTRSDKMNGTQCRMARASLGWSLDDLAAHADVNKRTIMRHEADESVLPGNVAKMRTAFEARGVQFIGSGVYVGGVVPPKAR